MAIIGKIRQRSTLVLIIIGGAILAFVLSDLFSSSQGGQQGPINLAEVNDNQISPTEYDLKVNQAYETYQTNQETNEPLDERTKSSIRQQVWNEMLSDIIIGEQMKKLGVEVTSKELFDLVQGANPHPQVKQAFTNPETGEFNSAAVVQFLQNLDNDPETKARWVQFEKALKRNQRMDKFNTLVNKGVYFPAELAGMEYADNNTSVSFNYVYKPYSSVKDTTITVTEEDIQSYYDENKEDYEQEASIKAFYAYFPVAPSQNDIAQTQQYMNETYEKFQNAENDSLFVNANSDEPFDPIFYSLANKPDGVDSSLWKNEVGFMKEPYKLGNVFYIRKVTKTKMAPDSVKASHILISNQERKQKQAEKLADSLLNALNNGASMENLAPEYSDDPGSAQKLGDLGWFTEGTMVMPFNDAAFSTEVGEIVKVETQFGFHLIKVTDRTELKKKVQIASIRRDVLAGKETYADIFNQANSFSINATDLESFNELVREGNIQRRSAVLGENDNQIQNLAASRDVVRWIKDANEGDISEAYDVDEAFVVAIVESINKEGVAPLEKVKNRVEYMAIQKKKAEMFQEQMSGAESIQSLAESLNLEVKSAEGITFASAAIPQVGVEPTVVGKAMSLEQGQMSVPIEGKSGVFVVSITNKSELGDPNLASARATKQRGVQSRIDNGAVFSALKEKAEIKDNRSKFY
jgi:peptidyl-prolyl cis-trans isomerase D